MFRISRKGRRNCSGAGQVQTRGQRGCWPTVVVGPRKLYMSDLLSEAMPDVVVDDPLRAPSVRPSGVIITMVRVIHFRCLRAVEFPLGPTTVLIGENNAGKTSFLEALHAAIGAGQRHFSEEDIWLDA